MVKVCVFVGCTERDTKESRQRGISFHNFPRDPERRRRWQIALKRLKFGSRNVLWDPKTTDVVCSQHFDDGDFRYTEKRKLLKTNAVPNKSIGLASSELVLPSVPRPSRSPDIGKENLRLRKTVKRLRNTQRNTKKREDRLKKTVKSLIADLHESNTINNALKTQLEDMKDFPIEMFQREKSAGNPYSKDMRKFALTLHLYGPKAYEYAASKFPLPTTRTLRKWLFGIGDEPGLTEPSFALLKELRNGSNGWQYDICGVVIDAMSLKESLVWVPNKSKMVGLVDFGQNVDIDGVDKPAHEALVIMAVGIRAAWKLPLAYFFISGVTAEIQAQLLRNVFDELLSYNVIPVSITLDGMITNVKTVNLLGCSTSPSNLQCFFPYPSSPLEKIFVFFDPCHNMKNVRNAMCALRHFVLDGCQIRWSYIVKLHDLQSKEGLVAGNKLTSAHINFHRQMMKVRLATQTLSSSVANGIRLCRLLDIPGFRDSDPTERFIETMDRLFDILNSHTNFSKGKYKRALSMENIRETRDFLQTARQMLLQLKNPDGRLMTLTKRSIGFVGFVMNIDSLLGLTEILVDNDPSSSIPQTIPKQRYLRMYCFSQDHLEIFFSAVRRSGGWNNNPSCREFQSIYRRFIARAGVIPSPSANVLPQDGNEVVSDDITESELEKDDHLDDLAFSRFNSNVLTYVCGWVVKKALSLLNCDSCRLAIVKAPLGFNQDFLLIRIKDNGGLLYPNEDVKKIVFLTESVIKTFNPVHLDKRLVMTSVIRRLDLTTLFRNHEDHFTENVSLWSNHLLSLVKLIVSIFIDLRQHHEAKKWNLSGASSNVRQVLSRTVIFRHQ